MGNSFLANLDWRFATKKFDASKQLEQDKLEKILEAIRMAPTSFGLQPFKVLIVTDPKIRAEIRSAAWGQSQVTDAAVLLAFCIRRDVSERTDEYLHQIAGGNEEALKGLEQLRGMIGGFVGGMDETALRGWLGRQAYIAMGFDMAACTELEVDSCPMEGFDYLQVDKILNLPAELSSVALLPIVYRAAGPEKPKVRVSAEKMFVRI